MARLPRVSPATMVWVTVELAPQGRAVARCKSDFCSTGHATRCLTASLGQGHGAGERQEGSRDKSVGGHCIELLIKR